MKIPDSVGVPLIVIISAAQVADTPAGKPLAPSTPSLDIPVAPVVECVIAVNRVLIHKVSVDDAAPTVLAGVTVMVPVAFVLPQPPVNKIL